MLPPIITSLKAGRKTANRLLSKLIPWTAFHEQTDAKLGILNFGNLRTYYT